MSETSQSINNLVEFLMIRDNVSRNEAHNIVKDTMFEILQDPYDTEDILEENLRLDINKFTELLHL